MKETAWWMLVILGSAALVYDVAWYAGSSPAFNEAPMRDGDIAELLVDFDHYGNTATERFSIRMSVSIGIESLDYSSVEAASEPQTAATGFKC
jgi:hypothetical protein